MGWVLTKEQEMLQKSMRDFAEREIRPVDKQIEEEDRIPQELIEKVAKAGLLGITVDKKYGGMGGGYLDVALAVEQIARVSGALAFFIAVNTMPIIALEQRGSEEQKAKYFPGLASGKTIGSWSFTEHSTGSDPREIYATAKLEGDYYICNGTKGFSTNAEYDGPVVIFLRTGEGPFDISAFIGEKNAEGYSATPRWPLLGLRGMRVTDIQMKNYRIPAADLLGKKNDGFTVLLDALAITKVDVGAAALGIAQDALEQAIKYAKEKTARGKPIGNLQMIQFLIAEMASEVEAGRCLLYHTMSLVDERKDTLLSGGIGKLFLAEMADHVCQKALQVHGGYGYTKEFRVERLFRDAKFCGVVEGSNEIQRVIVARDMLK